MNFYSIYFINCATYIYIYFFSFLVFVSVFCFLLCELFRGSMIQSESKRFVQLTIMKCFFWSGEILLP